MVSKESNLSEARIPLELHSDFVPGENDVICGRGNECFNHTGNKRFRNIIESKIGLYSMASNRHEKSKIIDDIVHHVRSRSQCGGFVKKDLLTGRYCQVGDFIAREKTSQAIRDLLLQKQKQRGLKRKTSALPRKELNSNISTISFVDHLDKLVHKDLNFPSFNTLLNQSTYISSADHRLPTLESMMLSTSPSCTSSFGPSIMPSQCINTAIPMDQNINCLNFEYDVSPTPIRQTNIDNLLQIKDNDFRRCSSSIGSNSDILFHFDDWQWENDEFEFEDFESLFD